MWRYAYDDLGELVGISDARGCGENFAYDAAGRLAYEDYIPCGGPGQAQYTTPTPSTGDGTEAYYQYEGAGQALQTARATDIYDRAAHVHVVRDGRARVTEADKQLAVPSSSTGEVAPVGQENQELATRYAEATFTSHAQYDDRDRIVSQTTGTTVHELNSLNLPYAAYAAQFGPSAVVGNYSTRGILESVTSSYGPLVTGSVVEADGRPDSITYGDAAQTTTTYTYGDTRRRLTETKIARAKAFPTPTATYKPPPAGGTNGEPTQQVTLVDDQIPVLGGHDGVGNPLEIDDARLGSEWTAGDMPVWKRQFKYDDSYRLTSATTTFASATDTFAPPLAAPTPDASLFPLATPANRVGQQTFTYDGAGNTIASTDDAQTFFDRSLGTITNGGRISGQGSGPNQLTSAALTSDSGGNLQATYDAAGNMVQLAVQRNGPCTDGNGCNQLFEYDWDEVGNLSHARRFDFPGGVSCHRIGLLTTCTGNPLPSSYTYPTLPTAAADADVTYAYDGGGTRVLRSSLPSGESTPTYNAEIFSTLRLDHAQWQGNTYEDTLETEVVYLGLGSAAYGRVVNDATLPAINGPQHVFLELTDPLGSTSVVIDKDTSELVERTTYLAYGALDSDYRPGRWDFREDYKFTGKEDDVEIGLTYFGARYYSPQLGRFISPDPLAVHTMQGDLNVYAYVHGRATTDVDPDGQDDGSPDGISIPAMPDAPMPWVDYTPATPVPMVPSIAVPTGADNLSAFTPISVAPAGAGLDFMQYLERQQLTALAQVTAAVSKNLLGFGYGFMQGLTPGGIAASLAPLPAGAQTPAFQAWTGAGQRLGGLIGAAIGIGGGAGGIVAAPETFGASAAVVVVSAAAVANGFTAIGVGWQNLHMAAKGTSGGDRAGKAFTPKGRETVIDAHKAANGGRNDVRELRNRDGSWNPQHAGRFATVERNERGPHHTEISRWERRSIKRTGSLPWLQPR